MKINQIFTADNFSDPGKMDWVRREAEYLLKIMESDPNFILVGQAEQSISPSSLLRFFRHQERMETCRRIMQYLLSFLDHIPTKSELASGPVDPAVQLGEFIRHASDLLLEEDVKNAVFDETNHDRASAHGNVWDFQEKIVAVNQGLQLMLAKEEGDPAARIANQCLALEQLSNFWFDVRRHDLRHVRRSDIFIYLLAQLVRQRCLLEMTA
jgi:hypothetical protein